MRFYSFVVRSVMRRRVRSALTVTGIAVAVCAVVALVGISRQLDHSFLSIYQGQQVSLVVLRAGAAQRFSGALDERLGEKIARLPGVQVVNSGLVDMMSLPDVGPVGVLVQGWPPDSLRFEELKILRGHRLGPQDTDGVMLGSTLAESLRKDVGDVVKLYDTDEMRVVGIYQTYNVFENGGLIVPLQSLQRIMGREGQVTGFTVVTEPGNNEIIERVRQEILRLDKGLDVLPTDAYVRSLVQIRFVRAMAWLVSALALVLGTIGTLNTMIMSVFERTREIGILRAIGWRRGRVVRMILLESIALSLAGGAFGALGAILLVRVLSRFPAAAGFVTGNIDPAAVAQGFLIALVVGLIGAAYPAYRGAQLLPTEALRHE